MADVKISALPAATTPLAGTEVLPIVQSATTKQVSIANLTAGRAMSATSLTLSTPLSGSNGGTGVSNGSNTITVSASTTLNGGSLREALTADRTYYVATTGSDSNNGLSSGSPFLTIQKAINVVYGTLDLSGHNVTISVAAGTYTGANTVSSPQVGAGGVYIIGDTTTPSNVLINVSGNCFFVANSSVLSVRGIKLQATGVGIVVTSFASCSIDGNMDFGACGTHTQLTANGNLYVAANYTISGGASVHYYAEHSTITCGGRTLTLTGTPAFSNRFVQASFGSYISANAMTFSGSATGQRYLANTTGVIRTDGAGANYFPGNSAGSADASTYGVYS